MSAFLPDGGPCKRRIQMLKIRRYGSVPAGVGISSTSASARRNSVTELGLIVQSSAPLVILRLQCYWVSARCHLVCGFRLVLFLE